MPGSVSAAFGEPEDFAIAMRADGFLSLFVITPRQFRARLTQVSLNEIRLTAVEEQVSRVAFVAVPGNTVTIAFPVGGRRGPILGGMRTAEGEFATFGPGEHFHARTEGASHWATIRLPAASLSEYGAALVDGAFPVLSGTRCWRPAAKATRHLRSLHAAAIRMAGQYPQALVDAEGAHGLEQQLLHAVLECFSGSLPEQLIPQQEGNRKTMRHFEQVLQRGTLQRPALAEICAELQVRERYLRRLCAEHLGMSPTAYDRLRRMWLARHRLRDSTQPSDSVSTVARDNGFNDLGRFAVNYRQTFGESPSSTLRGMRTRTIVPGK